MNCMHARDRDRAQGHQQHRRQAPRSAAPSSLVEMVLTSAWAQTGTASETTAITAAYTTTT